MTKDEAMSVADYIDELHKHLSAAAEEVVALEAELERTRSEVDDLNDENDRLRDAVFSRVRELKEEIDRLAENYAK